MSKYSNIFLLLLLPLNTYGQDILKHTAVNLDFSIRSTSDERLEISPGISLSQYVYENKFEVQTGISDNYYLRGNYYQYLSDSDFSLLYSVGIERAEKNFSPTVGFGFGKPINDQYSLFFISTVNFDNDVSIGLQLRRKFRSGKERSIENKESNVNDIEELPNVSSEKEDCLQSYIVKKGEYFWMLGRRFNINGNALIKMNPQILDPNVLHEGDILCIKR